MTSNKKIKIEILENDQTEGAKGTISAIQSNKMVPIDGRETSVRDFVTWILGTDMFSPKTRVVGELEEFINNTYNNPERLDLNKLTIEDVLIKAARCDYIQLVKSLIELYQFPYPNRDMYSALAEAIDKGNIEVAKLLIDNMTSKKLLTQALDRAAARGQAEIVKLLIPVSDPKAIRESYDSDDFDQGLEMGRDHISIESFKDWLKNKPALKAASDELNQLLDKEVTSCTIRPRFTTWDDIIWVLQLGASDKEHRFNNVVKAVVDFHKFHWAELGWSLVLAAIENNIELVKFFIKHVNPRYGKSLALRFAAKKGNTEVVKLLIPLSDPEVVEEFRSKGLIKESSANSNKEVFMNRLKKIHVKESDPTDERDFIIALKAVEKGDLNTIKEFLKKETIIKNRDGYVLDLLFEAVYYGNLRIVKYLIPFCPSYYAERKFFNSLFEGAAILGWADICSILLYELGVNAKANNSEALRRAVEYGHTDVVKVLIPFSDLSANNFEAFITAVDNEFIPIVKLLLPYCNDSDIIRKAYDIATNLENPLLIKILEPATDPDYVAMIKGQKKFGKYIDKSMYRARESSAFVNRLKKFREADASHIYRRNNAIAEGKSVREFENWLYKRDEAGEKYVNVGEDVVDQMDRLLNAKEFKTFGYYDGYGLNLHTQPWQEFLAIAASRNATKVIEAAFKFYPNMDQADLEYPIEVAAGKSSDANFPPRRRAAALKLLLNYAKPETIQKLKSRGIIIEESSNFKETTIKKDDSRLRKINQQKRNKPMKIRLSVFESENDSKDQTVKIVDGPAPAIQSLIRLNRRIRPRARLFRLTENQKRLIRRAVAKQILESDDEDKAGTTKEEAQELTDTFINALEENLPRVDQEKLIDILTVIEDAEHDGEDTAPALADSLNELSELIENVEVPDNDPSTPSSTVTEDDTEDSGCSCSDDSDEVITESDIELDELSGYTSLEDAAGRYENPQFYPAIQNLKSWYANGQIGDENAAAVLADLIANKLLKEFDAYLQTRLEVIPGSLDGIADETQPDMFADDIINLILNGVVNKEEFIDMVKSAVASKAAEELNDPAPAATPEPPVTTTSAEAEVFTEADDEDDEEEENSQIIQLAVQIADGEIVDAEAEVKEPAEEEEEKVVAESRNPRSRRFRESRNPRYRKSQKKVLEAKNTKKKAVVTNDCDSEVLPFIQAFHSDV
jgi:ankyrin repeat protein